MCPLPGQGSCLLSVCGMGTRQSIPGLLGLRKKEAGAGGRHRGWDLEGESSDPAVPEPKVMGAT